MLIDRLPSDTTTHDDRGRAGSRHGPRWLPGHSLHEPQSRAGDLLVTPATDTGAPVICAIEDDGLAPGVLATGAVLAERLNVPLTVVHSPHPDVFLTGEPHRVVLERGNALVDRLTEGYHVDGRVVEVDEPGRLISGLALEGASMIVVGTRRRTGLGTALLGSVSQAVIARAQCPVVTVSALASRALETKSVAGNDEASGRRRAAPLGRLRRFARRSLSHLPRALVNDRSAPPPSENTAMPVLCRIYSTDDEARAAVDRLLAAGFSGGDVRVVLGTAAHDHRDDSVGGFAGCSDEVTVGSFADVEGSSRDATGSFAGDPEQQRRGGFADADRETVTSYHGGVPHVRVTSHRSLKKMLVEAGLDPAAANVEPLHHGRTLVLVRGDSPEVTAAALDAPGAA